VILAVGAGVLTALVTDVLVGAFAGRFLAIWGVATLFVLAMVMPVAAFQVLLGLPGTGVGLVVFVVIGDPSAGGSTAPQLLPDPWRAISQALPPGAAVTAMRDVVYFQAYGATRALLTLGAYAVLGAIGQIARGDRYAALPVRIGAFRGNNDTHNGFMLESMIDDAAREARIDPMLGKPRSRVLQAARMGDPQHRKKNDPRREAGTILIGRHAQPRGHLPQFAPPRVVENQAANRPAKEEQDNNNHDQQRGHPAPHAAGLIRSSAAGARRRLRHRMVTPS